MAWFCETFLKQVILYFEGDTFSSIYQIFDITREGSTFLNGMIFLCLLSNQITKQSILNFIIHEIKMANIFSFNSPCLFLFYQSQIGMNYFII